MCGSVEEFAWEVEAFTASAAQQLCSETRGGGRQLPVAGEIPVPTKFLAEELLFCLLHRNGAAHKAVEH